MFNPKIL